MEKKRILISILFIFLILIVLISGAVNLGTPIPSDTISNEYAPGDVLKGSINISLIDVDASAMLSAFNSNISIKNFLDANNKYTGVDYFCTTSDCQSDYSAVGSGTATKSFNLIRGSDRVIGIKLTSVYELSEISKFSMKVSSTSEDSCSNPLKIDILNDGTVNWKTHRPDITAYCSGENFGCYNPENEIGKIPIERDKEYCNVISIPFAAGLRVGADLVGSGNADFILRAYDDEITKDCIVSVTESGRTSCIINMSTETEKNFTICILAKDSGDADKYNMSFETTNPCGFLGDYRYDFAIFTQAMKYDAIGDFILNDSEIQHPDLIDLGNDILEYSLEDYLSNKYNNNCSSGCVIPLKFISNQSQEIILSDVQLLYRAGELPNTANLIYDLEETTSKIDMPFTLLDISKAGLLVPTTYGHKDLVLKLGGEDIASKQIEIIQLPLVEALYPQEVPAALDVVFRVYTSGPNASSFEWVFGDNSSMETSSVNYISHKYNQIGVYDLEVTAKSDLGDVPRTFEIRVTNPELYLDDQLDEKQANINRVKTALTNIPSWIKSQIETLINFDSLESQVSTLRTEFDQAGGDSSTYVEILNSLNELEVPDSITVTENYSGEFIMNINRISPNSLSVAGAGDVDQGSSDDYKNAVFAWSLENIQSNIKGEIYSLGFVRTIRPIVSVFKVEITPIGTSEDLFFVIGAPKAKVNFNGNYGEIIDIGGKATGINLDLSSKKTIEFSLPGRADVLDAPIYFSPSFEQFILEGSIGLCNNNGVCDEGENPDNCRADCKPWGTTILLLFILIFIAFVVYIVLQEWYKRKYENRLFKDKDELFNLINFIDNAEKQKLLKNDIVDKLKNKGWRSEKITYAYKKFKGERTGLWEIPILKFLEKKQVKKELEKRKGKPVNIKQGQKPGRIPMPPKGRVPPKGSPKFRRR